MSFSIVQFMQVSYILIKSLLVLIYGHLVSNQLDLFISNWVLIYLDHVSSNSLSTASWHFFMFPRTFSGFTYFVAMSEYIVWLFISERLFVCLMVFNATLNNISVISWQSVLLLEETRGPRENHKPVASHWQTLSDIVGHLALIEIRTRNISGEYS